MPTDKKTILIVDDENSYRQLFSNELAQDGYLVIEAKSGKEGLQMAIEKRPDLILLDLGLPDMDGLSVLTELRKDEWGKGAKVFILTNTSDNSKLAEAMEKESFVYLIKSDMTMQELVSKVKSRI